MSTSTHNTLSEKEARQKEGVTHISLAYGHQLTISSNAQGITLSHGNSNQLIVIRLSDQGMEVEARTAKMQLTAEKELELSAPKIKLNAAKELRLQSQGNLITEVKKDALQEVEGANKSTAFEQKIIAQLGNVEIKANDDVKVDGERVLLNS